MYEVGMSTCGSDLTEALFRSYAAAGIAAAEISPRQGTYRLLDFPALRRYAEAAGVRLWSFHLPFMPFEEIDISALDADKRKNSVETNAELIKKAAETGIGICVIHPSGEPIPEEERASRAAAAKESLAALSRTAAACGVVLAVEDLPRTCLGRDSAELLGLLSADSALRVCFDTNHLLREPIADFIRKTGEKIATVHVSDYDFIDEKHWLPGEGKIDWPALYAGLRTAGYRGVWMYEVGPKAPRSLPRSRDLAPADFARSAREIFAGLPLTRVV